ncbi:ABC transporter permease [Hamadaea sp. NPDC050747]|uniref:ABC transporter permease n=1 Tax=Hamadaea sp. NPDC050747 TaxID=3155789 RepID=UPI0033F31B74
MSTAALPSSGRLGLARGAVELRQFLRSREAVGFSLIFPALLLVLLGSIFKDSYGDHSEASAAQVFSASMIAYGIISTAFITMGVGIAADREDGTLRRLRGTPMTVLAYFIGKLTVVAVATVAEVALMLGVGVAVFDMPLPDEPGRWLTFAWVLALSIVACTAMGVTASSLVRSSRSAGVVLNVPVVALQFLSGIFVHPITMLPQWMVTVASFFPVKWMGQGFRSVFLPDSMAAHEMAGGWEPGRTALVLGAWCVVGLAACLMTFRWTEQR